MSQHLDNHEKLMKDIGTVTELISRTDIKGLQDHVAILYDDLKKQESFHKVKYNLDLMEFAFLEKLDDPAIKDKYMSLKENIRKARIRAYDRLRTWDKEFKDRDSKETGEKIGDDIRYQIGVKGAEANYATDRLDSLLRNGVTTENFKYAYMSAMLSGKYDKLSLGYNLRLFPDSPTLYKAKVGDEYIESLLVDPLLVRMRELKIDGARNEPDAISSFSKISVIFGMLETFFGKNFGTLTRECQAKLMLEQYDLNYVSYLRNSQPPASPLPLATK